MTLLASFVATCNYRQILPASFDLSVGTIRDIPPGLTTLLLYAKT